MNRNLANNNKYAVVDFKSINGFNKKNPIFDVCVPLDTDKVIMKKKSKTRVKLLAFEDFNNIENEERVNNTIDEMYEKGYELYSVNENEKIKTLILVFKEF